MTTDWPFTDPPNLAVFTQKNILDGQQTILHVTHDAEDESWQFLGGGDADEGQISVVALSTIFRKDPSVGALHDLPLGWHACRNSPDSEWIREEYR